MELREYNEFPHDIKNRSYAIYPRNGIVAVDGFRRFNLKELKKIDLNIRLNFPHKLFVAIDKS